MKLQLSVLLLHKGNFWPTSGSTINFRGDFFIKLFSFGDLPIWCWTRLWRRRKRYQVYSFLDTNTSVWSSLVHGAWRIKLVFIAQLAILFQNYILKWVRLLGIMEWNFSRIRNGWCRTARNSIRRRLPRKRLDDSVEMATRNGRSSMFQR